MKLRPFILVTISIILSLSGVNINAPAKSISARKQDNQQLFLSNKIANNNAYGLLDKSYEVGYPAVDELEKNILGKTYADQSIYTRLNRLEKTVFGRTSSASLSARVDNLKNYTGNNDSYQQDSQNSNIIIGQDYKGYRDTASNYTGNNSIVLYDLEKQFLGTAYPGEPPAIRIRRLENHVFNEPSENYPMDARIQRLVAYADAQQSDDFFQDQAQIQRYNTAINGARAISLLFMILQFLL